MSTILPMIITWCMGVTPSIFMLSRVAKQAIKIRNEAGQSEAEQWAAAVVEVREPVCLALVEGSVPTAGGPLSGLAPFY